MLLRHFLILRPCDFEAWEADPEEWELEVTGDVVSAESGFRVLSFHLTFSNFILIGQTAGEALFVELFYNYKDEMKKFLAGCIQSLQRITLALSLSNLLN